MKKISSEAQSPLRIEKNSQISHFTKIVGIVFSDYSRNNVIFALFYVLYCIKYKRATSTSEIAQYYLLIAITFPIWFFREKYEISKVPTCSTVVKISLIALTFINWFP